VRRTGMSPQHFTRVTFGGRGNRPLMGGASAAGALPWVASTLEPKHRGLGTLEALLASVHRVGGDARGSRKGCGARDGPTRRVRTGAGALCGGCTDPRRSVLSSLLGCHRTQEIPRSRLPLEREDLLLRLPRWIVARIEMPQMRRGPPSRPGSPPRYARAWRGHYPSERLPAMNVRPPLQQRARPSGMWVSCFNDTVVLRRSRVRIN